MARKADLRLQRAGTVINLTSSKQETELGHALTTVVAKLQEDFGLRLHHDTTWKLADIVSSLKSDFPDVVFARVREDTYMQPDGGILSVVDRDGGRHVILIVEVKNQGTNVERIAEGKPKQAKGNAIERLGKNVIGLRTAMVMENIMPFVCFGYGCDFADDSSILDRVITMAMFGAAERDLRPEPWRGRPVQSGELLLPGAGVEPGRNGGSDVRGRKPRHPLLPREVRRGGVPSSDLSVV